ncbi:MAG: aryl-sulfate sulfotransferase, partial [Myxococcales bacterium]|nr:aryl-sulfate sulfotransferase [Myxococcales bacterium]
MARLGAAAVVVLLFSGSAWAVTVGDAVTTLDAAQDELTYDDVAREVLDLALSGAPALETGIQAVSFTPSEAIPLAGILHVETDESTVVTVSVAGPNGLRDLPPTAERGATPALAHEVLVAGLRADTRYDLFVTARDPGNGAVAVEVCVNYTTPPLPAVVPTPRVLVRDPDRMAPGYTLFSLAGSAVNNLGLILIVDDEGQVVWYRYGTNLTFLDDVRQRANGNLLFVGSGLGCPGEPLGSHAAVEVDLLGEVQWEVRDCDLGVPVLHHEIYEKADGNFLTLSAELRKIGVERLVGDVLVEFTPAGEVVNEISTHDLFPIGRRPKPYELLFGFWLGEFGLGALDWTHGNAIIEDPRDGTYIASFRNLDITAKITPEGALRWVLAADNPDTEADDALPFLTLIGDGSVPSHQHAPQLLPNGHLLIYDNGVATVTTRVVEYEIDEDAMTARQVWEWVDPDYDPPLFGLFVGDADMTDAGTVLVCDGG